MDWGRSYRRNETYSGGRAYGGKRKEVSFPPHLTGLLIGKGGSTIQELKRTPGVLELHVKRGEGKVEIEATSSEAIEEVEKRIMKVIGAAIEHRARGEGFIPGFSIICIDDCFSDQTHFKFEVDKTATAKLNESFSNPSLSVRTLFYIKEMNKENQQNEHLRRDDDYHDEYDEDYDEAENYLTMPSVVRSPSGFCPQNFLRANNHKLLRHLLHQHLQARPSLSNPELKFKIGVLFGKTYFVGGPSGDSLPYPNQHQMSVAKLANQPNHKLQFSPSILSAATDDKLRDKLLQGLGFSLITKRKSLTVHLLDIKTKEKSVIAMSPPQPEIETEEAEAGRVLRVLDCCHYFQVLKLNQTATDDQVQKAYRMEARGLHPDKNSHPLAGVAFCKVKEALEALSCAEKRAAYHLRVQAGQFKSPLVRKEEREAMKKEMPKIRKYVNSQQREGFLSLLTPGLRPEFRLRFKSEKEVEKDPKVLQLLHQAWEKTGMESVELVVGGETKQINLIRQKQSEVWTNGVVEVKLTRTASERLLGSEDDEFGVRINSCALKEMLDRTKRAKLKMEQLVDEVLALVEAARVIQKALSQ